MAAAQTGENRSNDFLGGLFVRIWKTTILWYLGGMLYCGLELLWRGWTHGSMFAVGGLCFLLVGGLDHELPVVWRMLLGAILVTTVEFFSGLLLNRALALNIWDYSAAPLNLYGQICLPFTLLWIPVSGAAIFTSDCLRHALFGEPIPQYSWVI